MVRRYEEPVQVRVATAQLDAVVPAVRTTGRDSAFAAGASELDSAADSAGTSQQQSVQPVPDAFVWRGRLYLVREILGHWRERSAWWRTALDGTDSSPGQDDLPQAQAQVSRSPRHDLEQHVWRVEASPGRMHGTGVYDLACERPARDDPAHGTADSWRIVRVAD